MDTIFKNSRNCKTLDPHRLLLNILDKINLKRSDKYVALSNLSIYYTWKNIKRLYINNKYKIAPTRKEKIELTNWSNSISYIQDHLEFIIKKHETVTDNHPIRIYVNKIVNRITFRIETGSYLQFLTSEITDVVLVYCNIVKNDY